MGALTGLGEGHETMCQSAGGVAALLLGNNGVDIDLPRPLPELDSREPGQHFGLHSGRLALVMMVTGGLDVDEVLEKDLRDKHGKPTKSERVNWSNPNGGRWEVDEKTWELKDLNVEYKPISKLRTAESLTIFTAEGKRLLDTEIKREVANRPRL